MGEKRKTQEYEMARDKKEEEKGEDEETGGSLGYEHREETRIKLVNRGKIT